MASHDERRFRETLERSLGRELSDEEWAKMVHGPEKTGRSELPESSKGSWISRHMWWIFPNTIFLIVALSEVIPRFSQQLAQFAVEHAFHAYGAGVSLLVSAAWAWILANYMPKGHATDASHIWIDPTTRARVSGASERDVYEHYHGYGSWWEHVREVWDLLRILGFFIAVGSPHLIAYATDYRAWLLGEDREFAASLAAAIAGGVIYIAILRVRDIKFSVPSGGGLSLTRDERIQLTDWMTQWFAEYWWLLVVFVAVLAVLVPSTLFLCLYYFLPAATQAGLTGWYAFAFYAFSLLVSLMVILALVLSPTKPAS